MPGNWDLGEGQQPFQLSPETPSFLIDSEQPCQRPTLLPGNYFDHATHMKLLFNFSTRKSVCFEINHSKFIAFGYCDQGSCTFVSRNIWAFLRVLKERMLLFTRPLPRDGGMAEDHGAPEAGQLPRVWTRGHKETESRQRVSGAKSP